MQYTPVPWFLNDDCIEAEGPEGPRDATVATVNTSLPGNARLIANAPDLVDRLEECCDWLMYYATCDSAYDCLDKARELIAFVKGDGNASTQE